MLPGSMNAELVDVELIVGEQDEILEVLRARCRVVRQAVQRIVDALCRERRQRQRFPRNRFERSVGDMVVGGVEIRHVENIPQRPLDAVRRRRIDMRAFQEREMHRDRRFRFRNGHRYAVVAHDHPELVDEVVFEEIWPRHRRGIVARRRHVSVGEAGIDLGVGRSGDADFGIERAEAPMVLAALGKFLEGVAQEGGVALIEQPERGDRLARIGEALPGKRLRTGD
jgi:hypothetical protein